MKHRGRSPSAKATKDTLRSGTGGGSSSGRSIASDHEHDLQVHENNSGGGGGASGNATTTTGSNLVSSHPSGASTLAAMTSTLVAATAEESLGSLTLPSMSSSNVSPTHHPHHKRHHSSTFPTGIPADPDNSSLGNSIFYDDPGFLDQLNSGTSDPALTLKAIEHYQGKIGKTKEEIKKVQTSLDDNVNEYLKLFANATDSNQQQRIKQVFEKKNQKSAQHIAQLQKKLDEYEKKKREVEKHGLQKHKMRDIGQNLKNVGGNIRDGIAGISNTVMSGPKDFANFVLRHDKYGSADNLSSTMPSKESKSGSGGSDGKTIIGNKSASKSITNSSSLPRDGSAGSAILSNKCLSEDGATRRRSNRGASEAASDSTSNSMPPAGGGGNAGTKSQSSQSQVHNNNNNAGNSPSKKSQQHLTTSEALEQADTEWNAIVQELTLHKEEVDRVREEMDELRQQFDAKVEGLHYKLQEERENVNRLEDQINDMTELHQHEIENIKSGITDMEEKVQYQSEERLSDIKEHLERLETKLTSMEHQQTQQQYLNIEGLDSSDARAIMMKLLNALFTFVHVILFLIGTFMNLTKPFLRTTPRILSTTILVIISVCVYYQQDALTAIFVKLKSPSNANDKNSKIS